MELKPFYIRKLDWRGVLVIVPIGSALGGFVPWVIMEGWGIGLVVFTGLMSLYGLVVAALVVATETRSKIS